MTKANVQLCEWFALCVREAVTARPHPLLGPVPICALCDAKIGHIAGELSDEEYAAIVKGARR